MLQFTADEQEQLRQRISLQPQILYRLIADNQVVLAHPLQIPKTGIATWGHYYFCPTHGVRLEWDRNRPHEHRCPVDDEQLKGEPFDGAWWRIMNGHNCRASYQLGLLWMLTQENVYAQKVQAILLAYARYYPDYEVHGGIPCNGPGKMNIQTLCEANCLLELARGYDLIRDTLTAAQQKYIEERLFRPAATFLCEHRENQLHNHEVKINTAIGVLGLLLDDEQLVHFAIDKPWGLRWQLQNGLYAEGLWFEGSAHYHFYVLQGYFDWEKFARYTPWSLMDSGQYERMLDFPLCLLMPDGAFPLINDAVAGQQQLHHYDIYEFAFRRYQKTLYAAALQHIYRHEPRDNLDAFLYGAVELPDGAELPQTPVVHAPGCGLTLVRQPDQGNALLIKHMPFSGEHDHYDYLAITLWWHGHAVLPDLGTTGYGADLHRQYYKNSATHNTLSINLTNPPPARPETLVLRHTKDGLHLGYRVDWRSAPPPLPTFSLPEWDEQAWRDIRFSRHIVINEDLVFDIAHIDNPHVQTLYWTLHIDGEKPRPSSEQHIHLGGPLALLKNLTQESLNGATSRHYRTPQGDFPLWLAGRGTLYEGSGPANPAVRDLSYLVLSSTEPETVIAACYVLDERLSIEAMRMEWSSNDCHIHYRCNNEERELKVPLMLRN